MQKEAQRALGLSRGGLLSASGAVLNRASSLAEAEVRSGDVLTLHARPVSVAGFPRRRCHEPTFKNFSAFAAILGDGSAVSWGCEERALDSRDVHHQLENVQGAFAALLHNGSLVTWGDPKCGGDCSAVADRLTNVHQIQSSARAFAAVLGDGSVVTWGHPNYGAIVLRFSNNFLTCSEFKQLSLRLLLSGLMARLWFGGVVILAVTVIVCKTSCTM